MLWTAGRALDHWVEKGLLSEARAEELRASLREAGAGRSIRLFAGVGALLMGLGAILFVASNWNDIGPLARAAILVAGWAGAVVASFRAELRGLETVSSALWLLVTLALGANIFLLAQVFNFTLTYWQGPFLWMIGALALGWARHSPAQAAVAVPLGVLALGWLGGGGGWFFDDQMEFLFGERGLRPVLALLGVALVAGSLLLRRTREWSFATTSTARWGLVLLIVPLLITSAHVDAAEFFFDVEGSPKQLAVMGAAALLALAAVALGWGAGDSRSRGDAPGPDARFADDGSEAGSAGRSPGAGRRLDREVLMLLGGVTVFLLAMAVQAGGRPWVAVAPGDVHWPYALYVVALFVLALVSVQVGIRAENTRLVNAGMAGIAILVLIQYFSWSFRLLDRSLAFLIGGALLLGLSTWLERKRRSIVARIA